jgi:C4-dicarboxylate-specific signal transduction histidine kinase
MPNFTLLQASEDVLATDHVSWFVARQVFEFLKQISLYDYITIGAILFLFLLMFFITNRENSSFKEYARKVDSLEKERDTLESKISSRSLELLNTKKDRLQELSHLATIGELSKGLFHDLSGPLNSISLYIENLKNKGLVNESDGAIVDKIVDASKRMNSFMDKIRQYNNDSLTAHSTTNIRKEIDLIRDILAYKIRHRDITLNIDCADNIFINKDSTLLHQIFINLINNAIDCFPDTQIDKNIDIQAIQNDKIITINISDNGPGIPIEYRDLVFKHQFTTKPKGSGIGLDITNKITTDFLNGSISFETSDLGTRFVVKLPVT